MEGSVATCGGWVSTTLGIDDDDGDHALRGVDAVFVSVAERLGAVAGPQPVFFKQGGCACQQVGGEVDVLVTRGGRGPVGSAFGQPDTVAVPSKPTWVDSG